ncbi:MAG: MATE family efflux transporter, partial [Sneathiellales bacterium]|nr:MATE family efflux transporter [Sneathiellales bacterium]
MSHAAPSTSNLHGFLPVFLREMTAIAGLTVPIVIGLVSGVLMGIIDTAMVSPLGEDVLAAAGLATSAFIFINATVIGFVTVMSVNVAQAVGARNLATLSTAITSSIWLTLGITIAATAIMFASTPLISALAPDENVRSSLHSYWIMLCFAVIPHIFLAALRGLYNAVDRPWTGVTFTLFGVLLNIPLNMLFIHGGLGLESLGLLGAGLASLIAKSAGFGAMALHWRYARSMSAYRAIGALDPSDIFIHFRNALPVAIGSLGEGGAYAATGLLIAAFGTITIAANQVVHSVGVLFYMVPIGLMIASSIRIGGIFGAQENERLHVTWVAATTLALAWSICVLLVVFIGRDSLAVSLSPTPEVIALATVLFAAMALIQLADSLQSTALGLLRGLSDNVIPNAISIIMYWLLALPLAWVLGFYFDYGAPGVLTGYATGILLTSLVLHCRVRGQTRNLIRK